MNHDLYIFGSAVRGEVSETSDIDVLVIPFDETIEHYPRSWSVYSSETIESYYSIGKLFAWHLFLEAKCIYSKDETPFLTQLGTPAQYSTAKQDIEDLCGLLLQALCEIRRGSDSYIYELGLAYTAIRDIAMVASWHLMEKPCFSRSAPYIIPICCPLATETYKIAMLARHTSTRGIAHDVNYEAASKVLSEVSLIEWIDEIRSRL